ncbi:MAG: OmpA family protein [Halothiobacillaceae bacterium]|nr:OmpA family protein [Halothiobacillaceae bacterium]HER35283.1 flagellar motor protein MotB [Halothiobacillaceae bacterium]
MTATGRQPSARDVELQQARVARVGQMAAGRDGGRPWSEGWEPDVRQVEDDQSYWLLTMVDLMTLLLTLFVLLAAYAYQHKSAQPIDPGSGAQIDRPANTDRPAAGPSDTRVDPAEVEATVHRSGPSTAAAEGTALIGGSERLIGLESKPDSGGAESGSRPVGNDAAATLAGRFRDMGKSVEVSTVADRVQLRVRDNILFPTGEASLSTPGKALLARLADRLTDSAYRITVEGHTDDRPIDTWRYPSNWELSAARAAAVVRQLIDAGIRPSRLNAVGLADTQPIADNGTLSGRAENRRVDLVLDVPPAEETRR